MDTSLARAPHARRQPRIDRPRRRRQRRAGHRRTRRARATGGENPTVGKFMGLMTGKSIIIGLITEVGEQPIAAAAGDASLPQGRAARSDRRDQSRRRGAARFQRGVTEYPKIGDAALLLSERELRLVYGSADADRAHIGDLQQNPNIPVHIDIDHLVSQHFAMLGTTGVGKSSGVAIILQKILDDAAEPAHLPGRSAQRIRPLLRRQGAGAHAAQSAAAVLAVQFRGDGRRLLRRPSRRRRRSRNPVGSHSAGEGGLSAISQPAPTARSPRRRIRATPASPSTRRCPTASRT